MAKGTKEELDYRKKRIKRIKKIIVTLCVIVLISPMILSFVLLCRVNQLEHRIDEILSEQQQQEQMEEKDAGVVKAEEKKEPVSPAAVTPKVEEKKVYLTFDDGPSKETKKVLDVLKKKKVKATFFTIGRDDEFSKSMYKRIVKEGHTLGMHSYSHIYKEIYGSIEEFQKDFQKISDYLFDVTGIRAKYYRFPGGSSNSINQIPIEKYQTFLESQGVVYMDWNVIAANGTTDDVTQEQMVQSVMDGVSKYETSIVLLYDSADKKMTAKSLETIINSLQEGGYEILPIDEDTPLIQHVSCNSVEE